MKVPRQESFSVREHLETRRHDPDFHLVEFGHSIFPIAFQQGVPFYEGRSYTGIEGWLVNPDKGPSMLAEQCKKKIQGQNIRFITQDLGSYPMADDGFPIEELYEGEYNTRTPLRDDAASEVVASNVLTDPLVADIPSRSISLLREMGRIIKPSGLIVLRETITPKYREYVDDGSIALAGLQVIAKLRHGEVEPQAWQSLEEVYDGDLARAWPPADGSHYTILSK